MSSSDRLKNLYIYFHKVFSANKLGRLMTLSRIFSMFVALVVGGTTLKKFSMNFFWERSSFILHWKNKIIFSGKTNTIFPNKTRWTIFQWVFFGKAIFLEHLQKISYFHDFFWERSSFIFHPNNKIIFLGKKVSSFLKTQGRLYSGEIFLGRPTCIPCVALFKFKFVACLEEQFGR